MDILAFQAQLFAGTCHIFQTDTKALTYLAHYHAHNTFHSECCKDPSLVLFCLTYILCLSAKSSLIYMSLSQSNALESVSTLSDCLTDILFWMESSKLKLNPDKTDFIIVGTKQQRNRVISHFLVILLGRGIFQSDTVRNLGVFDGDFNCCQYISQVCKSCFHHIRDLRRIQRHILSISAAKQYKRH